MDRADSTVPRSFADVERRASARTPELGVIGRGVGHTPLAPVPSRGGRGTVWLKTEASNATGTVKARTAYALLCGVLARCDRAGLRLVEYTGGSMGVALADACARLGIDLHLVFPPGSPASLHEAARARGAAVSFGPDGGGFLGTMDAAARIAEDEDRRLLLQHAAGVAVAMHRERTGREIVDGLVRLRVDPVGVAAACGTGGTLIGVLHAMRERWSDAAGVAVFPAEAPYGDPAAPTTARRMNGTGGLGLGVRQPLLRDDEQTLRFRDMPYADALGAVRDLRSSAGIAACTSGAAAWAAASELVDDPAAPGRDAVAILAGRGTPEEWHDALD
nr:pyridoxal-phosphate dependent enzyme [Actinomycetospora corticicola]